MKTLFKNGLVYDGSGSAPIIADLLIENEVIVGVGNFDEADADKVVDCTNLCVCPGFIDAHSHNDFFVNYNNAEDFFAPFIKQGITTQISGNCGFSPFGVDKSSPYANKVGAGLFEAKNPSSFKDFCNEAQGKLFVNLAPLIGHGTTRIGISGLDSKQMDSEGIEKMKEAVREAMENGAFGGSFGFMYEPGMYSKQDELVAFASTVAEYDGIVTVHPRANSKVAMGYSLLKKNHIEIALDECIDIMQKSKCKMQYSHLIFVGESSWKSADRMINKFYDCRAKGYDIAYDNYSMTYGASVITVICPPWYMALNDKQKHSWFNRFKLRLIINITKKLLGIDYQDITIAYINDDPKYKAYEGRNVAEIAKELKRDPLDLYLELIDASQGGGKIYLSKYYNDELIKRLMQDELSIFMTDAWLEPKGVQNGSAFQGYPNFLVLAQKYNIPWEKIIHKMTGKTAERFGLQRRGTLASGNFADVTIFSPDQLKIYPNEPGRSADGIKHVVINGKFAVEDGNYATQTNGHLLLKSR